MTNKCEKGFTLIETIMVMVVIVILAAVVIIRNPFDSIKLSSATRKVAADIRYAQKLAISSQLRCGIVFSGSTSYTVFENDSTADPAISPGDTCSTAPDGGDVDTAPDFIVDTSQNRCSNYADVTFTLTPTIYFNSLGTPDSAATVRVSYKGTNKDINIEGGTGRVSY